jgi:Rrf2 family protein
MQLSRRADYSVRAMLDIASAQPDAVTLTREVSERQEIPHVFLTKIVTRLVQANLLRAYRGAKGGIVLAVPAEEISLLQIVEAVDGPIALNRCVRAPSECPRDGTCAVHDVWCKAQSELVDRLEKTRLSMLIGPAKLQA